MLGNQTIPVMSTSSSRKGIHQAAKMDDGTMHYGIYLGAKYACITYCDDRGATVVKDGQEYEMTPCAVYINRNNELIVGRKAKERVESDPDNVYSEFMLRMGTGTEYVFERSRRKMKPEELSAEVLKTLLANVQQRTGRRPDAAVITVPAAFELPHCAATTRAAELAGLQISPLLQEPVAAALAYGFQNERDGVYWLVYDFGGGTFDAAVIAVRDGMIEVVAHEGDNHLGGKNIDWKIVEDLLIPKVAGEFHVTDFRRGGHSKWRGAIAKLKGAAEDAKIQLSSAESADIHIDFLCQDDQGSPIEFDYTLTHRDFERVAEPIISRSIQICRSMLTRSKLMSHAIGKILLVGETTRMPYLRQRLEEELRIPLECSLDPTTVVARGAAIFARVQRLEPTLNAPSVQREFAIVLEGNRVGPEQESFLGGKIVGTNTGDLRNYTIEFINQTAALSWRSGKIKLSADGAFLVTLWAERGLLNRFNIDLRDDAGRLCNTTPNHWEYEVGSDLPDQPLIHSLGITTPDGGFYIVLHKGCVLPACGSQYFSTRVPFAKGQSAPFLSLPLYEGDGSQADLNRHIGKLLVNADDIHQDLPAGTEVKVTIEVDKSRLVRSVAFIPDLDKEFEALIQLLGTITNLDEVHSKVKDETARFERLRMAAEQTNCGEALGVLEHGQQRLQDLELAFQRAGFDRDACSECQNYLRNLQSILSQVEAIIQSEKTKQERLAGQAVLLEGLKALYGKRSS